MAKRSLVKDHLSEIPPELDEEALKKYARAYLIYLLGLTLFADKSGKTTPLYFFSLLEDLDRVRTYSLGSVALAYLCSQLCSASKIGHCQIGGAVLIIQFWSWERLYRIGVPKVIVPVVLPPPDAEFDPALRREWSYVYEIDWPKSYIWVPHGSLMQYWDAIQKMHLKDFIWRPYDKSMFELLNSTCVEGRDTAWRADVSIICFNIIEWHHLARVARHNYIALWYTRHERSLNGDMAYPGDEIDKPTSQYVDWYSKHTRRLYQPKIDDGEEGWRTRIQNRHGILSLIVQIRI
ncbi:hypothetical protein QQ045_026678 [Rhodiola kirilowii]